MPDRIPVFSEGTNEPHYFSQREIAERFEVKEEMLPYLTSVIRYASGFNVATFEKPTTEKVKFHGKSKDL